MENNLKFVGFWKRVLIYLIDLIIYFIAIYLIGYLFIFIMKLLNNHIILNSNIDYMTSFILYFLIPLILVFLLWNYKGGSIGMLIFKVRIIDLKTMKKSESKKLFLRLLGMICSHFTFFISFLCSAFDSRKQTWHDKISGTALIKLQNNSEIEIVKIPDPIPKDKTKLRVELVIFSIFMIISIIFIYFLFHDEKLLPEAKEWMKPIEFVEENLLDNEYYFLIGFDCPINLDPSEVGHNWVKKQNNNVMTKIKNNDYSIRSNLFLLDDKDSLKILINELSYKYVPFDSLSIERFIKEKGELIDSVYTEFNFMFDRFDKIGTFPYFQNTQIPHFAANTPLFSQILPINRYKNYWIAKQYLIGNKNIAINELEKNIDKSHYLMRNAQSEILKFLSHCLLEDNLKCIAFLLNSENITELSKIKFKPIVLEERDWNNIAKNMFKDNISNNQMLYSILKENYHSEYSIHNFLNSFIVKWKFKFNKSINQNYKNHKLIKDASELPAIKFVDFIKSWDFEDDILTQYIIDPVGTSLSGFALVIYKKYLAYPHNLNGYINMLKLKLLIKQKNISPEEIPSFLEAQSDSLFNPYTEESIKWDAENSMMFCDGPFESDEMRKMKVKF